MIYVYIAGPLSRGDPAANVRQAALTGMECHAHGFAVYIPHLTFFVHMVYPMEYEEWMRFDQPWLEKCDCVLRLAGPSPGADRECYWAGTHGKPIFYSIDEIVAHYGKQTL